MALTNIFREPRREITESLFGILLVGGYLWLDFLFARCVVDENSHDYAGDVVFCMFGGFLGTIALIGLIFFTHFVGEEICGAMRRAGFDPRPRNRK